MYTFWLVWAHVIFVINQWGFKRGRQTIFDLRVECSGPHFVFYNSLFFQGYSLSLYMSTDVPAHMPYQNNRSVLIVAFAVLIYTIQ